MNPTMAKNIKQWGSEGLTLLSGVASPKAAPAAPIGPVRRESARAASRAGAGPQSGPRPSGWRMPGLSWGV
jgi:hypothetical protein